MTNFLHIEEVRELVHSKKLKITEEKKNVITSITKDKYYSGIKKQHSKIKKDVIINEIGLKKISYSDFVYETKNEGGLTLCLGILYFKYNNKTYQIESTSIYTGKKYGLIAITDLKRE